MKERFIVDRGGWKQGPVRGIIDTLTSEAVKVMPPCEDPDDLTDDDWLDLCQLLNDIHESR